MRPVLKLAQNLFSLVLNCVFVGLEVNKKIGERINAS